ncbi:universal stress protein [Conexibacter sp. CPCC 206217]|uniref:universal stress protein n=1 Tax=Conexibacter sp. CPCC 206217 TaxID=3064574 RepID=UPI0027186392|nr:universal stress protein [Conexibacter sp. CPCC 206217]MDO8213355.1 universal stress protein [Conexibacter sp. CPCC 206217]
MSALPEEVAADEPRHQLTEISARNVLVAVDGTPEAWDAVGLGVQIVRATRGRLTLLTVVVPAPAWTQVGLFAPPADGSAERAAEERLRELTDAIPPDLPVTTQLLHGDAAHLIAQRAEEGNHDLVVLAAHEHGPIGAAIESVQRRLLKCTHVPVLAIHRPTRADKRDGDCEPPPAQD